MYAVQMSVCIEWTLKFFSVGWNSSFLGLQSYFTGLVGSGNLHTAIPNSTTKINS